jgi:hypothetical protein
MADEPLVALKAREAELAREWQWLVNALHAIAAARAGDSAADAFRLLHDQCMTVGQRRVEMNLRIAALEGPPM